MNGSFTSAHQIRLLLLSIVLLTPSSHLLGNEVIDVPTFIRSASRTKRLIRNVPASVTVLSKNEIEQSPALVLDDLLRTVPSLSFPLANSMVSHPTDQSFSIRGIGNKRVLILVDGIPANDPFGGWIHWAKIPLHQIEQIEIVRGGGSNLFGNYAMGGVINIITITPQESGAQIESLAGSLQTYQTRGKVDYASDSVLFSAGADYFQTGGYRVVTPETVGSIFTDAHSDHVNFNMSAQFRPTSRSKLKTSVLFFKTHQYPGTPLDKNQRNIFDFSTKYETEVSQNGEFQTVFFSEIQSFETENSQVLGPDFAYLANVHETPSSSVGGSLHYAHNFSHPLQRLSGGVDFQHIEGKDKEDRFNSSGVLTNQRDVQGIQDSIGIFAESSFLPTKFWEIEASGRVDHWENRNGRETPTPGTPTIHKDRTESEFSPRLSTRIQTPIPVSLLGSIYRAFRSPTLDELYRGTFAPFDTVIPNANLNPEVLKGGEAGFQVVTDQMNIMVMGFLNKIDESIADVSSGFTKTKQNIGKTKSKGIETTANWKPHSAVHIKASHVLTDSTIDENPQDVTLEGNRQPNVSKNVFIFETQLTTPSQFKTLIRGRYLSNQFSDTNNLLPLGAHFILDLTLSKTLNKSIEVFIMGENILDREYLVSRFGGFRIRGAPVQIWAGFRAKWNPRIKEG